MDPKTKNIFVANDEDSTITVLNADKNYSLVKKITVGKSPSEILFDDKSRNLYVANSGSDSLSIISPDTLQVERTVLLGANPFSIAYDEAEQLVYVTNQNDNTLSVINPDDRLLLAKLLIYLSVPIPPVYHIFQIQNPSI